MSSGAPQLIDRMLRRLRHGQVIALLFGGIALVALLGTIVYSQRKPDDELIDIPTLIRAGTQTHLVVTLSEQLAVAGPDRRGDLFKQIFTNIKAIENLALILRNSQYQSALPPVSGVLADFNAEAERLINTPITDSRKMQQATDQLTELFLGKVSVSIQQSISERIYQHDLRNSHQHVIITFLEVSVGLLVAASLLLGPISAYFTASRTRSRLSGYNRLRGDFLANLTHEIRTPINGIVGMSDLLLEYDRDPQHQHYARTLQSSAEHLLSLINDVLDFSKLEAGHMKLMPQNFNLLEMTEDVMNVMAARAHAKQVELLIDYSPDAPRQIVADPARLRQILFNLVGNAIKFTDAGYVLVRIRIKAAKQPLLICEVEDTGAGIPENKIPELFKKYAQIENTSDKAKDGTGLGLAICRNLLHLMGGSISVRSSPGRGTVFTWQVPVTVAGGVTAESHPALLKGKHILVMDDLAPNRDMYGQAIAAHGAHCLITENSEETLSCLAYELDCGRVPDFIVLDQQIPDGSGLDCARRIRTMPKMAEVPIAILTHGSRSSLMSEMADLKNISTIAKPLFAQSLCTTIHAILNGREPAAPVASPDQTVCYGLNVLLAEDNRVNAEISTELLQRYGCAVTLAENGMIALQLAQEQAFDLILMDCQMPVMDGFESAQRLRQMMKDGKIADTPIIALTANAADGDRDLCLAAGMADYLSKPVRRNDMEGMLRKWSKTAPVTAPVVTPNGQSAKAPIEGVDLSLFNGACSALGPRTSAVIGYFIEDSETYLANLGNALERKDYKAAILPAHSLKSSSQQLGLVRLSELAGRAEKSLRLRVAGSATEEDMDALLTGMITAFTAGRDFLTSQMDNLPLAS